MRYYKRRWEEGRGDRFDAWGPAVYFFETDENGAVLRQVEVYANGTVLRYDVGHFEDEYGRLADQPLDRMAMARFLTDETAFERAWPSGLASGPRLA
jgi:hypothetical protein